VLHRNALAAEPGHLDRHAKTYAIALPKSFPTHGFSAQEEKL